MSPSPYPSPTKGKGIYLNKPPENSLPLDGGGEGWGWLKKEILNGQY